MAKRTSEEAAATGRRVSEMAAFLHCSRAATWLSYLLTTSWPGVPTQLDPETANKSWFPLRIVQKLQVLFRLNCAFVFTARKVPLLPPSIT